MQFVHSPFILLSRLSMFRLIRSFFMLSICMGLLACGSDEKNMTPQESASVIDFPLAEYNQSPAKDCGMFDQDSTIQEAEDGRECVRNAFKQCAESKFYIEFAQNSNQSFNAFVLTRSNCMLRVHVVSNTDELPIGEALKVCDKLASDQKPETACGIDSKK